MKYIIYTEEIHKVHGSYIVEANSKEEALDEFYFGHYLSDDYDSEIFDVSIENKEIYEY